MKDCVKCGGKKKYLGFGNMVILCPDCDGLGYLDHDESDVIDDINSLIERANERTEEVKSQVKRKRAQRKE